MIILKVFLVHSFFFNDTATTEIYTLSLHDALPIYLRNVSETEKKLFLMCVNLRSMTHRSEEHTSELQSPKEIVCRRLLEKKKRYVINNVPNSFYLLCISLPTNAH